jgi:Sulfotransferase family
MADWIHVPPVFIIGCPRSGTTLLRLMLTAHPLVSISSEGAYLGTLRSHLHAYRDLSDAATLTALYNSVLPFLLSEKFLSIPLLNHFLDWTLMFGTDLRSIITFFGTWEARILEKTKLAWWGDNAPYFGHYIPFFDSIFPECKFILMVRDPRDTSASSKVSLPWRSLDDSVREWEQILLAGLLATYHLGSRRVIQLKYEDLVTQPGKWLRAISDFLGVEYSEQMLEFHKSWAAHSTATLDHHRNLVKPTFTDSIGRYRHILTQWEITTIQERLYTAMRYYEYLSAVEYEEIGNTLLARRFRKRTSIPLCGPTVGDSNNNDCY